MRRLFLIVSLGISSATIFAQGKIGAIYAPSEIPSSEEFTILLPASAMNRTTNRAVVIEYPDNLKLLHALAIDEDGFDTVSLDPYNSIASLFTKEKNRHIAAFADHSGIYSGNFDAVGYAFTFIAPKNTSNCLIKCCLVERGDPSIPVETPTKGKSKKKRPVLMSSEWRIVAPENTGRFAFSEITGAPYSATVKVLSGWDKTSRALTLTGPSRLKMHSDSALLREAFAGRFRLSFWIRNTGYRQTILRWHHAILDTASELISNALGEIELHTPTVSLHSQTLIGDGSWHNVLVSRDLFGMLSLWVDGRLEDSIAAIAEFSDIGEFAIGDSTHNNNFSIDELSLSEGPIPPMYIPPSIPVTRRNSSVGLVGLFHFEDFGRFARSSIFPRRRISEDTSIPPKNIPVYFELDSNTVIIETSSPILPERALLTVEQTTATKVTFNWIATNETGVKRYELQRRVGSFGEYETSLEMKSKQTNGLKASGTMMLSRASYSAIETLPVISRDIELYYRLAIIDDSNSVLSYTEPIKLEYGGARDVFVDQNKPNPFNPKTTISFRMMRTAPISIKVYDLMGLEMTTLFEGKLSMGKHSIDFDASNWPAGIYYYKVKTAHTIVTKKMVYAK